MTAEPMPTCGDRDCTVPAHRRYVGPLARRIAARAPQTAADDRPRWMRHLTARDQTGALR